MKILSPVFKQNGEIPEKYTCDGLGINPPLEFSDISKETKSLVLIVDDPDAPVGTFVHWIIFNIDPNITKINEDENRKLGLYGLNTSGSFDYISPCPPSGTHRYFFKLYALNSLINLPEGVDVNAVEQAIKEKVIEKAELMGVYKRKNF